MRKRLVAIAILALIVALFAVPLVTLAGAGDHAVMLFGRPELGSGCNFPCEDDQSFHAVDKIQPGAVSISAGGTVDFDIEGFHQVAIYEAGTKPKDIEPDPSAFPFIGDSEGLIYEGPLFVDSSFTFTEPGKYLVVCNIAPHFELAQMWGYVNVE